MITAALVLMVLFLKLEVEAEGVSLKDGCTKAQCRDDGPVARFPFRIKGLQPQHCGYPGFELSCSNHTETLLHLSESVKLNVKYIDYKHQTIELYYYLQGHIPWQQLHDLHLSYSRFKPDHVDDYTFFNCTSSLSRSTDQVAYPISSNHDIISRSTDQVVYAISFNDVGLRNLSSCTKMYYISSLPSLISNDSFTLLWSEPTCKHCESKWKLCRFKDNGSNNQSLETECFGKGNIHTVEFK